MMKRVLFLVMCIAGCAPQVVWVGKDPTHRLHAKILSDGSGQWVQLTRTEPRVKAVGTEGIVFSADGRRMAYPAQTPEGWTMMLDGVPQGVWDGVAEPLFSADGSHFAFLAESHDRWRAIVNNQNSRSFEAIQSGTLQLSHDGAHVALVGLVGECAFVVADNHAGPCLQRVVSLSQAQSTVAGVVAEGDKFRFLWGDVLGPPVDAIGEWALANAGTRAAYAMRDAVQWYVVVDGKRHGPWKAVHHLSFGNDDQRVSWVAHDANSTWVHIDGEVGPKFLTVDAVALAPHGAGFAYIAQDTQGAWVVTDVQRFGPFANVSDLVIAPDGTTVAFVARENGQERVNHAGRETPLNVIVPGSLTLARDGNHWAVLTGDSDTHRLWFCMDGRRVEPVSADDVFADGARSLRPWMAFELERRMP